MRLFARSPLYAHCGGADSVSSRFLGLAAAQLLSVCLLVSDGPAGGLLPRAIAGQPPFTEEQKLAAEAWKVTDKEFVDRSFGGQDWFQRRQGLIKATKATSREDTYDEIRAMLASLDDKYTRFLTPAMYGAVYAVASGDVAGVGVELAAEPRASGKGTEVTVTNVFEGSPAEKAGLKVGDVFLAVDGGELPPAISAEETSAKVRGPAGSKVGLKLRRAGDVEETLIIERGSGRWRQSAGLPWPRVPTSPPAGSCRRYTPRIAVSVTSELVEASPARWKSWQKAAGSPPPLLHPPQAR